MLNSESYWYSIKTVGWKLSQSVQNTIHLFTSASSIDIILFVLFFQFDFPEKKTKMDPSFFPFSL